MNNIIEFQNVSFRYDSDTETPLPRVIEHLDFSVRRGEFVAVLGHNGSGKSPLPSSAMRSSSPKKVMCS